MHVFKKSSLSSAPFTASLLVITSLTLFIGIFWATNEYQAYRESIDNIQDIYQQHYQARVKEEVEKLISFIDYQRKQNELQVKLDIRKRLQTAYTIASHNYRLYRNEIPPPELRLKIFEELRPLRWNNGHGYYFGGRTAEGIIDLFADEPYFEGKTVAAFGAFTDRKDFARIIEGIQGKEAQIYWYNLAKPEFPQKNFATLAFVKYFSPLDLFLGASVYAENLEKQLKEEILLRIGELQFGADGEAFCFKKNGTIISHRDKRRVGRLIQDLRGKNDLQYGRSFLLTAGSSERQGFVGYYEKNKREDGYQEMLGFIKAYRDWDWVLGTSMSTEPTEQLIAEETRAYRRISFRYVSAFLFFFALAVSVLLFIAFSYSLKIKKGINSFIQFFEEAANSSVKLNEEQLTFREFEDLARLANGMVTDRVKHEVQLQRNELRLDTLLRLGSTESNSLQEKYDFVLRRIVEITGSSQGYLALVNSNQSQLAITSFYQRKPATGPEVRTHPAPSKPLDRSGLPGQTVLQKSSILSNKFSQEFESYPYQGSIYNHLDVPIHKDEKIVVVAGVCNNPEGYENNDIRQMTMLLEGMWLHVLKKCADEERNRLERQIIAVSVEERSNIGRDLHDDLGSHLAGIELLSKVLQQQLQKEVPQRSEQVATIRNLIRDAIEKTRRLSRGLYPVHVVEYGLLAAVEELLEEARQMFNQVRFLLQWQGNGTNLGKNNATHLYYIAREAVFNSARHGKPQFIRISMRIDNGFILEISDDGQGYRAAPAGGLGFHTMGYRAKAIGAELEINSTPGTGTTITISGEGKE